MHAYVRPAASVILALSGFGPSSGDSITRPMAVSWYNSGDVGHIAVVRPGSITQNGPTAQAGLYNFNLGHVYPYFPQGTALEHWAHA